MAAEINAQNIVVGLDTSGVDTGVEKVKQSLNTLGGTAQKAGAALDGLGDETEKGFNKAEVVIKATARQIKAFESQSSSAIISMKAMGDEVERTRLKAIDKGIPQNIYEPILANMSAARAAAADLAAQSAASGKSIATDLTPRLNEMGMTAKGTAAALRNVPAQLTDIVVGLQGGQAPLTVLLQQGGQLKDMFGGVGNAAKVLGGYLFSLVNPYTVVLAAAAGLAYAYSKGAAESKAYNKALIETGGVAGVTAARLADMSTAVSNTANVTVGAAAEALVALASSGNIISSQFERVAAVAVSAQKATGAAVADTVKQFEELGKNPLSASTKLNESVNFLTLSVYEQIKALESQGRTLEAGVVAQNAFAEVMEKRTPKLLENIGSIEAAWNIVTQAVKGAGSALASIGRDTTLSDQAQTLREQIKQLEAVSAVGGLSAGGGFKLAALKAELLVIEAQVAATERVAGAAAAAVAERLRGQSAAISAAERIATITERAATKQEQLSKALKEYRQDLEKIRAADATSALLNPATIARNEQNIRDQFAGPKVKPGDPFSADREAAKSWAKFYSEFSTLAANAEAKVEGLNKAQAKLVEYLQSPAYANMAEPARQLALQQAYAAIETEQLRDALKASTKEHDAYINSLKTSGNAVAGKLKSMRDEVNAYDVSIEKNISLAEAIDVVAMARLQDQLAIEMSYGDTKAVEVIQQEIDARKELLGLLNSQEARKANIKASNDAVAEWKKTANEIERALSDSLMRAFEGGATFAQAMGDTITNMFKTMVLRPIVSAVVTTTAGAFGLSSTAAAAAVGKSGGTGALTDTLGIAGTVGQIFTTITNGFAAFGATVGNSINQFGGTLYNLGAEQIGGAMIEGSAAMGTAAAGLTAAAAGVAIGSLIAGNKVVLGMDGTTTAAIGTAIGFAVAGPLGAVIGGALGGLTNRAFGMGPKNITGSGISGNFGASGATDLQTYQNFTQKGGFFRSNKSGTDSAELDGGTSTAINSAVTAASNSVRAYAAIIGMSAEAVNGFTQAINISLLGLSAEDAQRAIIKSVTDFTDAMATAAYGASLKAFQMAGETIAATLVRLGTDLSTVNQTFSTMGSTLVAASIAGADAASKLVTIMGGAEAFTKNVSTYYEAFYTESERVGNATRQLTGAFNAMGIALPGTRDAFRDIVDSQDLMTDSGRAAYAVLIALAPAFNEIATATDNLAKTARDSAVALADAAAATAQAAVTSAMAAVGRAVSAERDTISKVYEVQAASVQSSLDAVGASVGNLQSLASKLKSTLDGMRIAGSDSSSRINAQADISAALAQARAGGSLPLDGQLDNALRTVAQPSEQLFSSFEEYAKDFYKTANDISLLQEMTSGALNADQIMQRLLNDQLALLKRNQDESMARLDGVLEAAQLQIDAVNGVNTSVLSVAAAVANLSLAVNALASAQAAAKAASAVSSTAAVTAVQNVRVTPASASISYDDFNRKFAAFSAIPKFAVGTNSVPYDMTAQIHKGERIIPAADNTELMARLNSPRATNDALIGEIRALREEVRGLRAEAQATASHTNKTARLLDRAMPTGTAIATTSESAE
jgi:hypothetical protein